MTEIQWLVDIMLHHKLPDAIKDKFIARIGEVEARLTKAPAPVVRPLVQAPSTQRILDEMNGTVSAPPEVTVTPTAPHPASVTRAVVGGEVITSKGNGSYTKGPRKF